MWRKKNFENDLDFQKLFTYRFGRNSLADKQIKRFFSLKKLKNIHK